MNKVPDPKEWLDKYGDYLYSIAMIKTGNRELARDLVQDTLLSALKAVCGFRGQSSEKTWLTTILNNKITDYYRKKDVLKNSETYLNQTQEQFDAAFFQSDAYSRAHWQENAIPSCWHSDQNILSHEFQTILAKCLEAMPIRLRAVFVARFFDEGETEEICKEFQITQSNFWVMIHRAKLLLRGCMDKNWFNA